MFGSLFGLAAWRALPRERHRIVRHLDLAYGETMSHRERELVARKFFINTGKNLIDILRVRRYYESQMKSRIVVEGAEHMEAAYRKGKGVLGITGHIGNFELLAVHVAGMGYPVAAIGREMYDKRMDKLLVENREALGVSNISTTDSPRRVLNWLKKGGVLGVLIDIDSIRIRSEFVPVFNRMALTPVGQSIMGLKMGSAFVPSACIREDNDDYKVIFKPEVQIERTDDFDADVVSMTAACSRALEQIIDEYRDQWIWLKNRWTTPYQN